MTLRRLVSLRQKHFFHLNVLLKEQGKSNKTPHILPSPEPALCLSVFNHLLTSLFWFSSFSFKHLHGLGVWLGQDSLAVWGRSCFSVGVCCCPSALPFPSPPHLSTRIRHSPPPAGPYLSLKVSHLRPPKNVFVSLFVLFVVGFILFLFFVFLVFFVFVFYNFEVFVFMESYYILLRKWGEKNQEATVPL